MLADTHAPSLAHVPTTNAFPGVGTVICHSFLLFFVEERDALS